MNKTYLWAALGAGLIFASKKVSAVPEIARAPMAVIGTLMLVKPFAVLQDKI